MNLLHAVILGIVEGLTEYLPVSSTGHLILTGHMLGASDEAADAFEIIIQLGAVLAVVAHYRVLLAERAAGLFRKEPASLRLLVALAIGFVPMAVVGLTLRKLIKSVLFGPLPVAVALIVGGIVMMVVPLVKRLRRGDKQPGDGPDGVDGLDGLEHVTPRRALIVGLGQCMALWPGMSRSMSTILAGEFAGLSTRTSAEFSFLLALPVLGAATTYEFIKSRQVLMASASLAAIGIGMVVSFFVAWAVIAAFLRYLNRYGLAPFGAYRVILGLVVIAVLVR
jgi:undecaprenyl-diphosphatase